MEFAPKIVNAISTVKSALSALWGVMAANPIALIIAAIAALVAAFVYLWNTSEEFRQFWIDLWERVKSIAEDVGKALETTWKNVTKTASDLWNGLKDDLIGAWDSLKSKAKSIWEGITGTVKGAIDKLKSFFDFKWELPKIELPHFSIVGKFSLNPPQVPHLDVQWYKKAMQNGMILTSPTIFGAKGNSLLGGGEAGPEAVVGVSSLKNMINSAVSSAMPKGGAGRSMTVIMQIDGSEFARTTVPFIEAEEQRRGVRLATT